MFNMLAAWLASAAWASPPQLGQLEGVVTSVPQGLAMPNVSITLRSATSGGGSLPLIEVRTTDRDGTFRFEDLPAGLYSLEAAGAGIPYTTLTPVIVVPGVALMEHVTVPLPRPVSNPRRS
jgi:hypothetical protein